MYEISKKLNIEEQADASVSPNLRSYYYWYQTFQRKYYGNTTGDNLSETLKKFKELSDVKISVQDRAAGKPNCPDQEMIASVSTPFMQRVLSNIPQSAEILFMDSTSNLDIANTNFTMIMTWSAVGALPVGFLLTETARNSLYTRYFISTFSLN